MKYIVDLDEIGVFFYLLLYSVFIELFGWKTNFNPKDKEEWKERRKLI